MIQGHGSKIASFGFLLLSACSEAASPTPVGTAGGNSGGSSTVAGTSGLPPAGMGGTAGASGGGTAGGVGGSAGGIAGSPSAGGAGADNGGAAGSANGGSGGNQPMSCAPARPHASGRMPVNIQHDGNNRNYVLFVPTGYEGTKPLPLVLDIHGFTSFATEELDRTKWDQMAEREKFLVVAPNGIGMAWSAGGLGGGHDDVGFIRAVVAKVAAELCIDEKRVYVTGHSNGGAMTHKLGCEAADLFAAMAPICGWTTSEACTPARPMAVAAVRSLDDSTVPYEGGGRSTSAKADVDRWLEANECADMPVVASHNDMCTTRTSCADGTQVMECHPPGGHGFYYQNGNPLPLPDTLWPFFKKFALP